MGYEVERDVRMAPGDGYGPLDQVQWRYGTRPNYLSKKGDVTLIEGDANRLSHREATTFSPSRGMPMTEVRSRISRRTDVCYVSPRQSDGRRRLGCREGEA